MFDKSLRFFAQSCVVIFFIISVDGHRDFYVAIKLNIFIFTPPCLTSFFVFGFHPKCLTSVFVVWSFAWL